VKFFFVDAAGDLDDEQLCFLEDAPDGIGVAYSCLCVGRSIVDRWPANATITMTPENPGIKLCSLVGNPKHFLLVHRDVKEVIEGEHARRGKDWPIEYLPVTIINHKGRPHSRDYFFINPLSLLVMNTGASKVEYYKSNPTQIMAIDKLVLDSNKLADVPPIFRLQQDPDEYVVDENLHRLFQEREFTNLRMREIEQQPQRTV